MTTNERVRLIRQLERLLAKMRDNGWEVEKVGYSEDRWDPMPGFKAFIRLRYQEPSELPGIL